MGADTCFKFRTKFNATKIMHESGDLDTFTLEAEEGLLNFLRPPKGQTGMEASNEEILQGLRDPANAICIRDKAAMFAAFCGQKRPCGPNAPKEDKDCVRSAEVEDEPSEP